MKHKGWSVRYDKDKKSKWHHAPNDHTQLVSELADLVKSGGIITDFRWFGKPISAKSALEIVHAADLKARSN